MAHGQGSWLVAKGGQSSPGARGAPPGPGPGPVRSQTPGHGPPWPRTPLDASEEIHGFRPAPEVLAPLGACAGKERLVLFLAVQAPRTPLRMSFLAAGKAR